MKWPRKDQVAGAAAVMVVPALLAAFLTQPQLPDQRPRVTKMLQALPDRADGAPSSRPTRAPDSPVAAAGEGGKKLSIEFKRGSRTPVGFMKIPAIGLRTKFFDGVVDEAVKLGPGHWPGTPWPGDRGNSVFAGHRTTHTHPFADLDLLENGSRVRVQVRNGNPTTYRVFRTLVVSEAEYARVVLKQPRNKKARIVTLFACTPKGSRSHRIIVQARAVPKPARGARDRGGDAMERS